VDSAFDKNSALGKRLISFGRAMKVSPPFISRTKKLIFLCGANRGIATPSHRRESLKKFIEGSSDDFRVIYAESVFNELTKIGHRKNALDLETEISSLADKIVIVLESASAFCELGAFAHKTLRDKLIVINDSNFKDVESFINTGPIAALDEAKAPVLWYPMSADVRTTVDGIGAVFKELHIAIKSAVPKSVMNTTRDLSELRADKISLYFVHDLVFFTGPITYKELISALIIMFEDKSYDLLSGLLGALRAAGLIVSNKIEPDTWVFRTSGTMPFMRYPQRFDSLVATFRAFHLKRHPERFSLG
jgi:hypothetical protein